MEDDVMVGHVTRMGELRNGRLTSREQAAWLICVQMGKKRIVGKFNVKLWHKVNWLQIACHEHGIEFSEEQGVISD
jgi:hypothetical protein